MRIIVQIVYRSLSNKGMPEKYKLIIIFKKRWKMLMIVVGAISNVAVERVLGTRGKRAMTTVIGRTLFMS